MEKFKTKPSVVAILIASSVLMGSQFAKPLLAEVKTALTRDVDNPALMPFRSYL